ncbi:hypothetical protein F3N42_12055 [Marinihelvus fidelis]|uniref:Bacterial virulence factor lipase N-terminal domain-containing protein n=1 Tax=Marinihelvus fidelis TaxID=2613842 RepID=A0A5N0T5W4_9GAMM|nr:hypothetical protein [Marinihelvus fidelis]KAA9130435.1 hypothetical protein F3N42_12055 [Marinihelvus fidelis]
MKNVRLTLVLLLFGVTSAMADPHPGDGGGGGARNKDGSIVTGVLTARFDPTAGLEGVPVPNNLFFLGTTDLTINVDATGMPPTTAALIDQINSLDGFSTIERWTTTFVDDDGNPGNIAPASVIPGQSVRVFQVTTSGIVAVTGIIRELTPGSEFVAVAQGNVVAVVPLRPLAEYSSYMAVLTNDIKDADGNNATPDQTYFLSKRHDPWVDANGNSTYALIDDETARTLEPLRQITNSMEAAAESVGIDHDDVILSWTVQTQSITPTLGLLRSIAQPAPVMTAPAGVTTSVIGGAGIADVHVGVITLPYYLGIPSEENPVAPITDFWQAEPGAYIPPFDQFGLDPTSTNVTVANPFPVPTGTQTVPLIVSVPNAASGQSQPSGGWPVVIYGHGLGSNRVTLLAMADALAAAGFVGVAIDFPLHGIEPWNTTFAPFYVENTPFGAIADERTFNVDFQDNATGAPGPDGIVDASGSHALNFQEFRTSRDNVRQGIADLSVLAVSLPNFDLNADGTPDLRPFDIGYAGLSWGGINGTGFSAIEPLVTRTFLSAPAGGLLRAGEASPTFGPRIRAGLEAVGIVPGDPLFELYLTVGQTVADSGDPINWVSTLGMAKPTLLHEVIGDTVLPNAVAGAPLSGTEAMIRVGALSAYSTTQANPDGLRSAARFLPPASHGSLLSPASSPAATAEMQGQMASFLASQGTFINVGDSSLMVQVVEPETSPVRDPREDSAGKKKSRQGLGQFRDRVDTTSRGAGQAAGASSASRFE